ncbi:recombination protein RecO [Malaciobacter mytili]|uniref:recombination protein RecO n=1 Tax=Malaciobacter mytili TaxID=603050 RepID=UPI00100A7BDA|nr:recombination protein RecO [Malaciobacter mytili]RXI45036.1 recombination protein RecO [Malaciobacter mytili]
MQGYILDIKPVKDDDLIVIILTENRIYTTYRFYGARHSNINIGYKIDFELEGSLKSDISRLRDVMQLNYQWILNPQKMYAWQRFIKLFNSHFRDIEEIDEFYFNLLNELVHMMIKQNEKRAILQAYLKLLEYEGRLHTDYTCFLCDIEIEDKISLVRSFLPAHPQCTFSKVFSIDKIKEMFEENSLINFTDEEIDYLWNILLQGL